MADSDPILDAISAQLVAEPANWKLRAALAARLAEHGAHEDAAGWVAAAPELADDADAAATCRAAIAPAPDSAGKARALLMLGAPDAAEPVYRAARAADPAAADPELDALFPPPAPADVEPADSSVPTQGMRAEAIIPVAPLIDPSTIPGYTRLEHRPEVAYVRPVLEPASPGAQARGARLARDAEAAAAPAAALLVGASAGRGDADALAQEAALHAAERDQRLLAARMERRAGLMATLSALLIIGAGALLLGALVMAIPVQPPIEIVATSYAQTDVSHKEQRRITERVPTTSLPAPSASAAPAITSFAPSAVALPSFDADFDTEDFAMGDPLAGGPSFASLTTALASAFFGASEQIPNTMEGIFIDIKMDVNGKVLYTPKSHAEKLAGGGGPIEGRGAYLEAMRSLIRSGARSKSVLQKYFSAPTSLYATHVFIPGMAATVAPEAFGVQNKPQLWIVSYSGQCAAPEDGRWRFVGTADDYLIVKINGRVALDGSGFGEGSALDVTERWEQKRTDDYDTPANYRRYLGDPNGPNGSDIIYGSWVKMRRGAPMDLEVLVGELPGGGFGACLLIQKEGAEYDADPKGHPVLPPFALKPLKSSDKKRIREFTDRKNFLIDLKKVPIFGAERTGF